MTLPLQSLRTRSVSRHVLPSARNLARRGLTNTLFVVAVLFFRGSLVFAGTTTPYVIQTGSFNSHFENISSGGFAGEFNNSSTEVGMFANQGSGQDDATLFETLNTAGNTSGTARSLKVGDQFSITMFTSQNPFGFEGVYFDNNTSYTSWTNYNTNERTAVVIGSTGNWFIENNGTNVDTGIAANNSITATLTITSSNTFNMTITTSGGTTTYYDMVMKGNPANGNIQSFSLIDQNDRQQNFFIKNGSLLDGGSVTIGGSNINLTNSGIISDGVPSNSTSGTTVNTLTKIGSATIILTGNNTYTGGTNINAGTLSLGVAQSGTGGPLGGSGTVASVGTISFGGGTLQYSAANTTDYSTRFSTAASQAYSVDTNGQTVQWAGNLTSSGGTLTKSGTGTLTLSGSNTYSGLTTVNAGEVDLNSSANAIGGNLTIAGGTVKWLASNQVADSASIILNSGSLNANGQSETIHDLTVNGGTFVTGSSGTWTGTGSSLTLAGGTTTIGDTVIENHLTVSGGTNEVQTGALVQVSATGVTMSGGTLTLDAGASAGTLSLMTASTTGITANDGTTSSILSSSATNPGLISLNGAKTFTIGTSNAATALTISAKIQDGTGSSALTKAGPGTLTLSANNAFSGGLNLNAGTVSSTVQGAIGVGGLSFNTGTLSIDTNTQTYSNNITVSSGGANGGTINANTANDTFNGTVTLGANRLIATGSDNTTLGGAISGTGDLLKQGSGTLTLNTAAGSWTANNSTTNGTNTSTALFVDNGTVNIGATGALGVSANNIALGSSNTGSAGPVSLILTTAGTSLANPVDSRFFTGVSSAKTIGGTNTTGTVTFSGGITLHDNTTLSAASGGTVVFSGPIATGTANTPYSGEVVNTTTPSGGFTGGPGVIISGGGTVEFDSNSNSFSGDTVVNAGTLQFNNTGTNAASPIRIYNGSTVNIANATGSGAVNSTVNPQSGSVVLSGTNTSGTNTFGGGIFLDTNTTVTSTNSGATLSFSGGSFDIKNHGLTVNGAGNTSISDVISNSTAGGTVTKSGNGVLTLIGANTYSGATAVNGGSLFVNNTTGSGTGSGNITVNNSGTTFGGGGTVSGTVAVNSGTNLSPGATGPGSNGVLHTGALTLTAANFNVDITGAGGTGNAGSTYDQVSVTGTLTLSGLANNLVVNASGLSQGNVGQTYYIALNDGTDPVSGTFAQGTTVMSGSDLFTILYTANGDGGTIGNDIGLLLTAVPEPGTWAAGGLATALLIVQIVRARSFSKRTGRS